MTEIYSSKEEHYETSWDQYQEYRRTTCHICDHYTYAAYMEQREDGNFYCDRCAFIPPYSDALYNGLVAFQRLFRAHFAAKAKPCGKCGTSSLFLRDFRTDMGPLCPSCVDEEIDDMREEYEREHDGHDEDPCEDCGQYDCVCAELKEDARLARHRRICGISTCEGDCGTLDCGCIDVCRGRCGLREW
jgi:hypothetical protein